MSIVQDALKKAQGDYVEKKMPRIEVLHRIKKSKSMRLPVLAGILVAFIFIYGLILSLQYFRASKGVGTATVEKKNIADPVSIVVKTDGPVVEPQRKMPEPVKLPVADFVLNGIMYLGNKPQALINGYILEEGDELNGATVIFIEKDCVLLGINNEEIKIGLAKHR